MAADNYDWIRQQWGISPAAIFAPLLDKSLGKSSQPLWMSYIHEIDGMTPSAERSLWFRSLLGDIFNKWVTVKD